MAANSDYYRIELDYPLDMDKIARLTLIDSGGTPQDVVPQPTKTTGGVKDHDGEAL